jgi:ectopic P granules protein 5
VVNILWPNISAMFSPWLIPYFPSRMSNSLSNWIKQVSIDQILLPWSERYAGQANTVLVIFVHSIEFLFAMLPASSVVLGHILLWYDSNYAHKDIGAHVIDLVHKHLLTLPWHRFNPTPQHIDCICRMLSQFLPKCHSFVGQILLRIAWTPWLQHNFTGWDTTLQHKMLQSVLMIFVQMAFEPIVHKNLRTIDILKEAQTYQWHMLDYQNIEPIFDWFVMSTEPTVVLRMASEHKSVDDAILE